MKTLNEDIMKAEEMFPDFLIIPLISQVSLQNMKTKANKRKLWMKIVEKCMCRLIPDSRLMSSQEKARHVIVIERRKSINMTLKK